MNNYTYTFIAIAVYLITIAVVYYTLHERFTDTLAEIETEYRLNFARVCTTFTDAMQSVAKALEAVDTDEGDKESSNE